MIHGIIESIVEYAVQRKPGVPPSVLQRLLIALFITASRAILWFVYGIFVAIPVFLFEIELFAANVTNSAFSVVFIVLSIGVLLGLHNAIDYWRNYERS